MRATHEIIDGAVWKVNWALRDMRRAIAQVCTIDKYSLTIENKIPILPKPLVK